MSKKLLLTVLLVLGFTWILGTSYYYSCKVKGNCEDSESVNNHSENQDGSNSKQYSFSVTDGDGFSIGLMDKFGFLNGTDSLVNGDSLQYSATKISEYLSTDSSKISVVKGLYSSKEQGSSPELGLSRAEKIKTLMVSNGAKAEQIKTTFELNDDLDSLNGAYLNPIEISFISKGNGSTMNEKEIGELAASLSTQVKTIHFATGSSLMDIKPDTYQFLENVSSLINSDDSYTLQVNGYTDNVGKASTNKWLSGKRANEVKARIMKEVSLQSSQIQTKGYGIENPIADNNTEEGKAKNRRVELKITKKQ